MTDAAPQLSSDELRQARLLFGEMDRDGNGVLDDPNPTRTPTLTPTPTLTLTLTLSRRA